MARRPGRPPASADTFLQKTRSIQVLAVVVILIVSFGLFLVHPPSFLLTPSQNKPVILYYRYDAPPVQIATFPGVVNFTLRHGFNTLMMIVFRDDEAKYNRSTVDYFVSYAKSRGLTLVPSYYIRSTSDEINVSGLAWVNLDMERLSPSEQSLFYDEIAQRVPLVSVTSPYGVPMEFNSPMKIVETYSAPPLFFLSQLGYYHPGRICSVAVFFLDSQQEYDAEKNYCQRYSDGVMVFDYYWLLGRGYT